MTIAAQLSRGPRGRMSPAAALTFAAVAVGGLLAATYVSPVFFITTIAVAAIIGRAATRPAPVAPANNEFSEFPPFTRDALRGAMSELGPGDARRLLLGVAVQGRPVFARRETLLEPGAEQTTRDNAAALVDACCDTALELARLDAASGSSPAALSGQAAAARTQLVDRLDRAAAALRSLYLAGLEHGTPASNRVAELVDEIVADASARRAAASELVELLGQRAADPSVRPR